MSDERKKDSQTPEKQRPMDDTEAEDVVGGTSHDPASRHHDTPPNPADTPWQHPYNRD